MRHLLLGLFILYTLLLAVANLAGWVELEPLQWGVLVTSAALLLTVWEKWKPAAKADEPAPDKTEAPTKRTAAKPFKRLRRVLQQGKTPDDKLLSEVLAQQPGDDSQHRLQLIARHSRGQQRVSSQFVRLTLLLDRRATDEQTAWQAQVDQTFSDLRDLLAARPDDSALVLLGPPGCGKSTLLERLEYDLARQGLGLDPDRPAA